MIFLQDYIWKKLRQFVLSPNFVFCITIHRSGKEPRNLVLQFLESETAKDGVVMLLALNTTWIFIGNYLDRVDPKVLTLPMKKGNLGGDSMHYVLFLLCKRVLLYIFPFLYYLLVCFCLEQYEVKHAE